jgi:hypothetical protein
VYLDGPGIARSLHDPRVENTALLGALSLLLDDQHAAGSELSLDLWLDVMSRRVPHHAVALNREAFLAGRRAALASA